MFTLKLYRRSPSGQKSHKVIEVERVVVMDIGEKGQALELWAFTSGRDYETYFMGEPEPGMTAYDQNDLHLLIGPDSWWGWGLLENAQGNTSEHYRPASYG